jgi:hypothetical protein
MKRDGALSSGVALMGVIAISIVAPQTALAAKFVDGRTGSNSNPCTKTKPCATIGHALGVSGAGDTVTVAGGLYREALILNQGRSLVHQNFDGPRHARATIDGGPNTAIEVTGTAAGLVKGFTIHSRQLPADLEKPATLRSDVFDQGSAPTTPSSADVLVAPGGDGSLITRSRFVDPTPDEIHVGIEVMSSSPTISRNAFAGFGFAIQVDGSGLGDDPLISGNRMSGGHQAWNATGSYLYGGGALVNDSHATFVDNVISKPRQGDQTVGIYVDSSSNSPDAGVLTERNRVLGATHAGVLLIVTTGDSLNDDLLVSNQVGLRVSQSDVQLTNVTVADNRTYDIEADGFGDNSALTLNSTIVGRTGVSLDTATCTSTYSRGPESPGDCDFATAADPGFADVFSGNFHLKQGSAMIDSGDPLAPAAPNLLDIDGDPRALNGGCGGVHPKRRDIGADEFRCPG